MPTAGTGPFWSVIIPAERTNQISNPSFEFGTTGWTGEVGVQLGSVSGTAAFGAWSAAVRGTAGPGTLRVGSGLTSGGIVLPAGTYSLSSYVWAPQGSVVGLIAGSLGAGTYENVNGTSAGWQRLSVTWGMTTQSTVQARVVAASSNIGTIYVDGVQIEDGRSVTTYIDGEQPGASWNGLPHASKSSRSANTRVGGSVVRLEDIGFTVDTSPGIGAAPFTTISQSYAQLDGGEFQRQRKAERRFNLTSVVSGTSWADLHYQRRRLIEALRIENAPTQQPMRILYSGAGGTVGINAVWDGGVQFDADGQSFSEGIVASFTAFDPDWSDQLQQGTTLRDFEVLNIGAANKYALLYRDPMGKWGTAGPNGTWINGIELRAINETLDAGTIIVGCSFTMSSGVSSRGLAAVTPSNIGSLGGGGSISYDEIYDLVWSFERDRLLIGAESGTAAGTRFGQLAWWIPSTDTFGTAGFIGTGTAIQVGVSSNAQIRSILPWQYGTYYLGGHFHRVNGTLLGTNWNIIQWNGEVGNWSAVAPVSVNGTGFIWNSPSGSVPGAVEKLVRYDQNRIAVGAEGNILRGFGGVNAALYDIRGTWGTIPGFTVSTSSSNNGITRDVIKTNDQQMFFGIGGNTSIGSVLVKVSGLTASNVGTIDFAPGYDLELDPDTLIWVSGPRSTINNVTPVSGLVRTNGYDYIPADINIGIPDPKLYTSASGTLYVGPVESGTAAALGTIQNNGMSNVYPTLRIRNLSSGTAVIRQWANMTTKEYAWFALSMFPGETVELTTGPGRVAFQSTYRGDILSTIVAGSKLASWHLQPGQNIISFLADTDAVVADMYWTPRHHSADGTGIV